MLKDRAQSLSEFALCVVVIVATFLSLQIAVRRNLQAKYKNGADFMFSGIKQEAEKRQKAGGDVAHLTSPATQYVPYYVTSEMTQKHGLDAGAVLGRPAGQDIEGKGRHYFSNDATDGTTHIDAVSSRSGWQKVGPADDAD